MSESKIVFYKEGERVPVWEWMTDLRRQDLKAYVNGIGRLDLLAEEGHKLDRPAAAYLGEGIYELRWKHRHVQYRILYFFHGRQFVVLAHAIIKKGSEVPETEIKRALKRKKIFEASPTSHVFEGALEGEDDNGTEEDDGRTEAVEGADQG